MLAARSLGYWVTGAQFDAGLRGVAMVLKDRKGDCKGAVGTTRPMQPQTHEQLIERFLPLLQDSALSLRPLLKVCWPHRGHCPADVARRAPRPLARECAASW